MELYAVDKVGFDRLREIARIFDGSEDFQPDLRLRGGPHRFGQTFIGNDPSNPCEVIPDLPRRGP